MLDIYKINMMEITSRVLSVLTVMVLTLFFVKIIKRIINKNKHLNGERLVTLKFFSQFLYAIIYFFGFIVCIYLIPPLRSLSLSIFASSGVLAIIIGFAAQHAVANIVSGIFIAIFKPFRIGDKIKFIGKDVVGVVEDITMRHTVVRTFENKRIIIPNSIISVDIIENSQLIEEKVCRFFEIGISYDSDVDKAIDIIKYEIKHHPDFFDNQTDEEKTQGIDPIKVKILGFGDFSVKLRAWVWARNSSTSFDMVCDLNKSIKKRFDKEGIEIPFPHRTIVYKNTQNQSEKNQIN